MAQGRGRPRRVRKFRSLAHTADLGLRIWGGSLKELFQNAAAALTATITDRRRLKTCLTHAVDDTYIVAYSTADNSGYSLGYIVSLKLWKNGLIGPIEPRKEFEVPEGSQTRCFNPIILRITEYVFAISYEGFGNHPGKLITLIVGKIPRGICKGSSYVLYANMTMVEGCINNIYVSYYNTSLGLSWHHFALTYDGMNIRLYVDGATVSETSYPYHRIKLTKEPLYFGRYYCGFIDEIAI